MLLFTDKCLFHIGSIWPEVDYTSNYRISAAKFQLQFPASGTNIVSAIDASIASLIVRVIRRTVGELFGVVRSFTHLLI